MDTITVFHQRVAPRSADLLDYAYSYAKSAHEGQERKYNLGPYILHPIAVARLVAETFPDVEMIAAAYLHDVVEDTPITIEQISGNFGAGIADLVADLTDISKPVDGNRAARKAIDRRHTANASPRAKAVKCADLIDNTKSIIAHDPGFARVYMAEKRLLLDHLSDSVSLDLYQMAVKITNEYYA